MELYHHGIKGQRWGVRRYQNDDGTLTPLGKAKYGNRGIQVNGSRNNIQYNKESSARVINDYAAYRDQKKKEKRAFQTSGDFANQKYMTDKERLGYAKGRVNVMGGKKQAISSETGNYIAKTGSSFVKALGSSLGAATLGAYVAPSLGLTALPVASTIIRGVSDAIVGAALGGTPVLLASLGGVAISAIARGSRYVKNAKAIKNVKTDDVDGLAKEVEKAIESKTKKN